MRIIKNRQIVEDAWRLGSAETSDSLHQDLLVGLEQWNDAAFVATRQGQTGLVLRPGDDVFSIQRLGSLPLIAIEFPKFTDGRGYSMARLLRDRLKYTGELRAVGNVLRDQLLFMQRCGFDAFELDANKDAIQALNAFDELTVYYQAASDVREPLFRRVARGV